MSIAAGFRAKWAVVMNASDASRGQDVDARYAAMAKAADAADLLLIPRDMAGAYQRKIAELNAALTEAERFMAYFAGETENTFAGPGTPSTCLLTIRAALGKTS